MRGRSTAKLERTQKKTNPVQKRRCRKAGLRAETSHVSLVKPLGSAREGETRTRLGFRLKSVGKNWKNCGVSTCYKRPKRIEESIREVGRGKTSNHVAAETLRDERLRSYHSISQPKKKTADSAQRGSRKATGGRVGDG